MSLFSNRSSLSFISLNLTQFFSAINDNLYKLLLVYLLIHIQGSDHSNTILALAGAIFVIPFLLFSSLAGTLADRYSKRTLIYLTRILEVVIMILGVLAFAYKSALFGYIVLFLLAFHSTLFSPCKYGILPEIVPKETLSHYNGIMTATTYLAIIFGTFLASFLTDITHKNFVLSGFACLVIAFAAALSSLGIKKTFPQAADKKISARFLSTLFSTLKKAKERRYLFEVILFGSYFLFMGAYTQLNIIPYTMQSLQLTEVHGGYLFLMSALGIGIGSYLAGQLSHKQIELGFIPLATFGIALSFLALYFFAGHLWLVMITLAFLGIFGGFYTVPIDSFIQAASPAHDRGLNVAISNFINFLGVVIAALLLAFFGNVLSFTAKQGFVVIGIVSLVLALLFFFLFLDQILRLLVAWISRFWKLEVTGMVFPEHPTLFIGTRYSWLDTIVIMATLPRLIRYIVPIRTRIRGRSFLYRLLHLIPLDISYFSPLKELTLEVIKKEIDQGHSLCLMQPVDSLPWEEILHRYIPKMTVPIVPISIIRASHPAQENSLSALFSLFKGKIIISYGRNQKI